MRPASVILLVEDDPEDQFIFEDAIRALRAPETVIVHKDGIDALEFLVHLYQSGVLPCIILADLNMPKMSGSEMLRTLKGDERFRDIPVIVYSTSINTAEKEHCLHLGAYAYITKPLTYKESLEVAEMILHVCRSFQEKGPGPANEDS
jgi:CheY-like chemotaxis protein